MDFGGKQEFGPLYQAIGIPRLGFTRGLRRFAQCGSASGGRTVGVTLRNCFFMQCWRHLRKSDPLLAPHPKHLLRQKNPRNPAVLKIVRVVNLLRIVFLVRRGDLLSRRTCADTIFLGITDIFPLKEGSMAY